MDRDSARYLPDRSRSEWGERREGGESGTGRILKAREKGCEGVCVTVRERERERERECG